MDNQPRAILQRFPQYTIAILHQIKENEIFESLCADYDLCMDMLKSLEKDAVHKNSKLEEYLEIKIELEQEVLKFVIKTIPQGSHL
jgi:hypothetical protein